MRKDIVRIMFEKPGQAPQLWETISQELTPDGRSKLLMRQGHSPHEHALKERTIDEAIASFLVENEVIGGLGLFPGERLVIEILNQQEREVRL